MVVVPTLAAPSAHDIREVDVNNVATSRPDRAKRDRPTSPRYVGVVSTGHPHNGVVALAAVVHPVNAMDRAMQVIIEPDERRRARRRAAEQGLTLSAYVARLIRADLLAWTPDTEAPASIAIADAAAVPDHEGMYIGEAVAARMNKPPE
jgi:hypothetical protein